MHTLLRTKAPVIGIPVEGAAPIAIDGKLLRAWAKGLTIERVEIINHGGYWYPEEQRPGGYKAEGPVNLIAERAPDAYRVRFLARSQRSRCELLALPRAKARMTLLEWAERERERIPAQRIKSSLTKDMKAAIKRAKYEDDGEGFVPVLCISGKDGFRTEKNGIPVDVPEWPEMRFALVRWGSLENDDVEFSVTERLSGKAVGKGKTGEQAIVDARKNVAKQTPERKASLAMEIALDAAKRLQGAAA